MKKEKTKEMIEIVNSLTQDAIETQLAYGGPLPTSHILMMLYEALHKDHQLTKIELKQILIYIMELRVCKHQSKD